MLTDMILALVKLVVEKVIIEQGKDVDWDKVKKEVQDKLDSVLPPSIWEDVLKYLVGILLDILSSYFKQNGLAFSAENLEKAVSHANGKLAFEVAKTAAAAVMGKGI